MHDVADRRGAIRGRREQRLLLARAEVGDRDDDLCAMRVRRVHQVAVGPTVHVRHRAGLIDLDGEEGDGAEKCIWQLRRRHGDPIRIEADPFGGRRRVALDQRNRGPIGFERRLDVTVSFERQRVDAQRNGRGDFEMG